MSTDHIIEIQGLRKSFKNLKVLEGVDLFVERGTILSLLGPNGAGKTTAIRILSTLLQSDGGRVMKAMLQMRKINIKKLQEAYNG